MVICVGMLVFECGYVFVLNVEQYLCLCGWIVKLFLLVEIVEMCVMFDVCDFEFDLLCYEYFDEIVLVGLMLMCYLEQEIFVGVVVCYLQGILEKVDKQICYEFDLIVWLSYELFFLIVYDIVKYVCSQNILCQGCGLVVNLVVCYCFGIIEVNFE